MFGERKASRLDSWRPLRLLPPPNYGEAITEHTQRISLMLGWPTTWPPAIRAKALALAGKSKWLVRQRTKTALHIPTGT